MSTTPNDSKDLLRAEYEHRFTEIMFHSTRYHKQIDFVRLFATLLLGVGALLLTNKASPALIHRSAAVLEVFYFLLLIMALILALYLFSTLMESLFMIYLNGSRIAAIEQQLNQLAGRRMVVWDSVIIPYFFSPSVLYSKAWIKPHYLVGVWSFLLFGSILGILACFCSFIVPRAFPYYLVSVIVLGLFHVQQWLALLTTGTRFAHMHMTRLSDPENDISPSVWVPTAAPIRRSLQPEHWAVVLTIALGPLVFTIASISTRTFDFSSIVVFPLLSIPSVAIGDAVLIPWFNFYVIRFLRGDRNHLRIFRRSRVLGAILIFGIMSLAGNSLLHHTWVNDPHTSFMDLRHGELSFAGWSHFAFSSGETAVVLVFISTWVLALRRRDEDAFRRGLRTWSIFTAFSFLCIVDFAIRHAYVLQTTSIDAALQKDWLSLAPFVVATAIFLSARIALRTRFPRT